MWESCPLANLCYILVGLFCNVCGRISPSDAESTASEQSSGRETGEETARPSTVANEGKPRRAVKKGLFVCFFFLVCSSTLLRLRSYSGAATFLNSSWLLIFLLLAAENPFIFGLVSSVETEELYIPFIPASFWNKWLSRNESCLLLSHTNPQQNFPARLLLTVSLVVAELQLHGQ